MYLIATLELSYAGVARFFEVAPKVRALMEANGVRMLHAMFQDVGRLNTVVHVWEMADADAYFRAVDALRAHEDFPEIVAGLAAAVVDEKLVFASDAPYAPRGSGKQP
ncbi:MAG TPA: NIPSNAP family protein [Sphingomonas sp.]|nr:NIPSNAP family protein [Sphingomonas sp.]